MPERVSVRSQIAWFCHCVPLVLSILPWQITHLLVISTSLSKGIREKLMSYKRSNISYLHFMNWHWIHCFYWIWFSTLPFWVLSIFVISVKGLVGVSCVLGKCPVIQLIFCLFFLLDKILLCNSVGLPKASTLHLCSQCWD